MLSLNHKFKIIKFDKLLLQQVISIVNNATMHPEMVSNKKLVSIMRKSMFPSSEKNFQIEDSMENCGFSYYHAYCSLCNEVATNFHKRVQSTRKAQSGTITVHPNIITLKFTLLLLKTYYILFNKSLNLTMNIMHAQTLAENVHRHDMLG